MVQLPLPLADHHRQPLCSMGRDDFGQWTGTYRRDPETAWRDFRHVQHNTGSGITGIYLDLDEPGALQEAVDRVKIPFPSVLMTRRENRHQAAAWIL